MKPGRLAPHKWRRPLLAGEISSAAESFVPDASEGTGGSLVLANLWMLKAPNGMFWYAVDYLRRLPPPIEVIVRPAMLSVAQRELEGPAIKVFAAGVVGFVGRMVLAVARREFVYVPTPHPLPLLPRQVVTFHDSFPFEGPKGRIKLAFFHLGVTSACATVAYINCSAALPFLERLGIPAARLLYAPNIPPHAATPTLRNVSRLEVLAHPRRLGAFGTDSPKKRYPELLTALSQPRFRDGLHLQIYGERNAYTESLRSRFPAAPFEIVDPKTTPLADFITSLDGCISIAPGEGFGRPLATAVASGLPCYLVDSPTFREFFAGLAVLDDRVDHLLDAALRSTRPRAAESVSGAGFLSSGYARAIESAVAALTAAASGLQTKENA